MSKFADKLKKDFQGDGADVEFIETDSPLFDRFMGGGVPKRKVVTMYGASGVGKSHIALEMAKAVCKEGLKVLHLDVERALARGLMEGLDLVDYEKDDLFIHLDEVSDHEDFSDIFKIMDVSGKKATKIDYEDKHVSEVGMLVIDSFDALNIPGLLEEGKIGQTQVGDKARHDSVLMRGLSRLASDYDLTVVLVQQVRNVFDGWNVYEDMSGCKAIKFFSDVIFSMKTKQRNLDDDNNIQSAEVEFRNAKNRLSEQGSQVIPIRYGTGFDPTLSLFKQLQEKEEDLDWFEDRGRGHYRIYKEDEEVKARGKDTLQEKVEIHQDWIQEKLQEDGS